VSPRQCWFRSKRGNTMSRFQELAEQVWDELRVRSAILDGEIVSLDEEGRHIFRRMLAGRGHMHYAVFDLLWLNGRDVRPQPLVRRKRLLEATVSTATPVLSDLLSVGVRPGPPGGRAAARPRGNCSEVEGPSLRPGDHRYKIRNRAHTLTEGRCSGSADLEWANA
jgi:hypothetical protein